MPRIARAAAPAAPAAPADDLPRWDLALFPGVDAPEFAAAFAALRGRIGALEAAFDRAGVGEGAGGGVAVATFERLLSDLNAALDAAEEIGSYLYGLVTADSRDDDAQARMSELRLEQVRLRTLRTRFVAWVGGQDVERLIAASPLAAEHAFPLRKMARQARHLMPLAEEALAAALAPSGGMAWARLHDDITSRVSARLAVDGEERERTLSELRLLAHHPDRDVRRRAYEVELAAVGAQAVPIAAAMNGIKGEVNVLAARRGWDDPLDQALFVNNMDRATLDALVEAAREAFPDLRRYLRAKARALGLERLAWYDLFAPVGGATRDWSWPEATRFVEAQFATYSERLAGLARRAFAERWVDAGPRLGKVGGAYCMRLRGDESRILTNFSPTYDAVSTLAHELGHAYHNLNEGRLAPLRRETPMTLAETASTFCETIVREAALAHGSEADRLAILEGSLQGSCQIVVDILSRFDFERAVFAARRGRELSVAELNDLMLEAQRGTYGDGLDGERLHPYMWAVKPHYYSAELSFYNFPYLFGLLFGLGLYARYREDPERFRAGYDELLAATGLADAATLAGRFGIDLRAPAFWRGGLDAIRADVDRFEALVDGAARAG